MYNVNIVLNSRVEIVSFGGLWGARVMAQEYVKQKGVQSVYIINADTNELIDTLEL